MDGGRRNAQNEDNQQTDLLRQALENDDINGDNSDVDEEDDGDDYMVMVIIVVPMMMLV